MISATNRFPTSGTPSWFLARPALRGSAMLACGSAGAAVSDEAITACLAPDDGTGRTMSELISVRMINLGGGFFVGTGRWSFSMDTIEEGDPHVNFEFPLHASAILRTDGKIELSLMGSDFERSVGTATQYMRFTRAYVILDANLNGTGRGFTQDEASAGGHYPLTLTSVPCP